MKKAAEKGGIEYMRAELQRLERISGSGSVAGDKLTEMSRKISVLSHFVGDDK